MLRPNALSTKNAHFPRADGMLLRGDRQSSRLSNKQCLNSFHAALRPYSCVVLGVRSRDGIANGGLQPTVNQANQRVHVPSLTVHGPTGIVPTIDSLRPADGDWGSALRQAVFDPRRRGRRAWTKHGRAAQIDRDKPTPLSSAMNRRCRSTAARAPMSIADASRCNGLPARS